MPQLHCYKTSKQCQNIQRLNALEDDTKTQRREHKFPGFTLVKRLHHLSGCPCSCVAERSPDKVGIREGACQSSEQCRFGGHIAVNPGQSCSYQGQDQL